MRILAIRGCNLASLADAFEVNFEAEPLRSAGLFAITGETGAGKSTILDALCLALYDKFPRVVAPGGGEGSPDPSGESLAASDPRAILRRGAARGFAEVDFVGKDGLRYRARCDLMRARGKAAGRLQNRGRGLWRLDEAGAVVAGIESGIEPVNARVVELTDLTFDQFRRTTLLAQGEFDAFLRADARERAELLEKITGAEIYGLLSQRAFERARAAQQALATLAERRAGIGVTSEEERAAIEARIAAIEAERAQTLEARTQTLDALRRLDALTQAQTKLAQAALSRDDAVREAKDIAPQRATLSALARAEPLRAPRDDLQRAEDAKQEATREAADAETQARAAQEAFAAEQTLARLAQEAFAASEGEMARFAPIWTQAAALDARIIALAQDEARARQLADDAESHGKTKRVEQSQTLERLAEAERDMEAARVDLARLAPAQGLSERWIEIVEWLTKRSELSQTKRDAERALAVAAADLNRGAATLSAFEAQDAEDRAACEKLSAQISQREAALAALDEPAASRRADELTRAEARSQSLRRCAGVYDEAQAVAVSVGADIARFKRSDATLKQELDALRDARTQCAAQSAEAERLGELAEAAADPHALRLRASLSDDAPCPVCGGRDHPFAQAHDAAQVLVEALRARRDATRRELARLDENIVSASARAAQTRALLEDASRRVAAADAAMARARTDYDAAFAQGASMEWTAPPEIEAATPKLDSLMREIVTARAVVAEQLLAARRLREERDRLRGERDEKRQALDARREERESLAASLQEARETRARSQEARAAHVERIGSLDRSLAPFLQLCDLSGADLDRDAASSRQRLKEAGANHRKAQERATELSAALAALSLQAERLAAEARAATEREAEAKAAWETRAHVLAEARDERARLLDGETTAEHRLRYEEKRKAAAQARDQARHKLADADRLKAACDERRARSLRDRDDAQERFAQARTAFAAALQVAGLDEATAAPLLALSPETQAEMRRAVQAAEAACAAAEAAVGERQADFDEARAKAPPETSRDELAARDEKIALRLDDLSAQVGALRERCAKDDEARGRAQALAKEIDDARAERKIWDEISEAIGSATGDKFRRFAQAATLEQLVALANQRLALLAPRYALERGRGEIGSLGLQIVDRDLGDERRSTRSLSGGERFLASLALALALAGLEGRNSFVDTLFIDEGFGALDSTTLDVAIDALEALQGQGRRVGVISHVDSLQQRIATKICVERRGGGLSVVRLRAAGYAES